MKKCYILFALENKRSCLTTGPFVGLSLVKLQQRVVNGTEGIADLGSKQAHDRNNDNGDESENDRVLNQTLTFFLGCE